MFGYGADMADHQKETMVAKSKARSEQISTEGCAPSTEGFVPEIFGREMV
jgi:hypothetical protein